MRIHQVLVGAREGDAITQIALSLRSVASTFGEAAVFARHVDPSVAGLVLPIDELATRTSSDDIVIFHLSIGDEVVGEQVAISPARLWVLYHNITPSSFFADDPVFAEHLDLGRRQLRDLAPRIERMLTVSDFNRRDLVELGFEDATVVPPMLDPDRLARQPSDPHFGREVIRRTPGAMFLFVGQVLPHKRPDVLVAAHHLVLSHHLPDATLVIAGHHPSEQYARRLSAYACSLGLGDRVWITGGVSDSRLAELYRRADVLVTASRHEGLCLPVIEAMAMSVPVVVSASGALPETVADCGLVVRDGSPEGFAEAMVMALQPELRVPMVLRGRQRARSMSLAESRTGIARLIGRWLDVPP
jgi:glycosyltransferase involved in cell wall biosynthesis